MPQVEKAPRCLVATLVTSLFVLACFSNAALATQPASAQPGIHDRTQSAPAELISHVSSARAHRLRSRASTARALADIDRDYRIMGLVVSDLDNIFTELTAIEKELGDKPVFSPALDDRLKARWAHFLRLRKVLLQIAARYYADFGDEDRLSSNTTVLQKRILLGYGASLFLYSTVTRLITRFEKPTNLFWAKVDEADPSHDYAGGELSRLWRFITKRANVKRLARARKAYLAAFPEARRAEAMFSRTRGIEGIVTEPHAAEVTVRPNSREWLHTIISREHGFIDAHAPSLWRAKLAQLWQLITTGLHKPYYKIFAAVSIWAGDLKYIKRPPAIGHDRITEMIGKLQPGDILLERENWFLSNAFLPGFWPHGILYVGTIHDLEELGLTDDPRVKPHLAKYKTLEHGFPRRVIEAISEGVVMSSMEEATDADYICAFRPRLSRDEIREAIARTFSHVGKPYDFSFDFFSADKLVCTEVLFRAYDGFLHFPLKKIATNWAIPASTFIETYAKERGQENRQLDFVFFLDSNKKTGDTLWADDDALIKSNSRPGLAMFLERER